MDVIILLVFISIVLVGGALAFFVWTVRIGTFEHSDRLALLPLFDELREGEQRRLHDVHDATVDVNSARGDRSVLTQPPIHEGISVRNGRRF